MTAWNSLEQFGTAWTAWNSLEHVRLFIESKNPSKIVQEFFGRLRNGASGVGVN
jgi:hypothetical protein